MKGNAPLDTSPDVGQTESTQALTDKPIDAQTLRQHMSDLSDEVAKLSMPTNKGLLGDAIFTHSMNNCFERLRSK